MKDVIAPINTSDGLFHDGDQSTGALGTIVTAAFQNDVQSGLQNAQSEIIKVLKTANPAVVLDPAKTDQLITALKLLFLQSGNNLSEIKTAGATSVAAAVANLGLGTGLTGVIGDARNAKMSVTASSATATFTADELIVGVALGGLQYRLGNFNKTINLATVGAGGMDTGAAPASGYIALYAIYNPTTAASALLAVNATAAVAPQVYGGANMPAGYTASALVSVVSTNASSQIVPLSQIGRSISVNPTSVLSTSTAAPSVTAVSVSSGVPKNALSVTLVGNTSVSGSMGIFVNIYETAGSQGQHQFATTSTGLSSTIADIKLPTPQTIYATYGPAVTGFSQTLSVCSYNI